VVGSGDRAPAGEPEGQPDGPEQRAEQRERDAPSEPDRAGRGGRTAPSAARLQRGRATTGGRAHLGVPADGLDRPDGGDRLHRDDRRDRRHDRRPPDDHTRRRHRQLSSGQAAFTLTGGIRASKALANLVSTVYAPPFISSAGECTITIGLASAERISGAFTCTDLSGGSNVVDVTGSFNAQG
jgi:hypothetical protein